MTRGVWRVAGLLLAGTLVVPGVQAAARQDPPDSATAPVVLSPEDWSEHVHARCREDAAATDQADAALRAALAAGPVTREQASFLTRETAARETSRRNARRGVVARLTTVLFGPGGPSGVSQDDQDLPRRLFRASSGCAVDGVEATVLLAFFGVPFTEASAAAIAADGPFPVVEARFRALVAEGASLAAIFATMRPDGPWRAHVEAAARDALVPPGVVRSATPIDLVEERQLARFLDLVAEAHEPMRIQFHLHAQVDAVEGAFGIILPDDVDEPLARQAERALHRSPSHRRRLMAMAPDAVAARLAPLVDRWFAHEALPVMQRSLTGNPHAAYWFYVQSGGVATPGPAWTGSRVAVSPAFTLDEFRGLDLAAALSTVARLRVPTAFQLEHAALETAAAATTFTPDDVRTQLARTPPGHVRADAVQRFLLGEGRDGAVSSLDVYAQMIRDASRIRGRVDRGLVRGAIDTIYALKADALEPAIAGALAARPDADPRLAGYLHTAVALMLEIERRQTTEALFQQTTSGAAVGWLLSRFFIGGHMPVSLPAPGGVTGDEFAALVDEVSPKNLESGNDYRARAATSIALVHDGREYHARLVEVVDSARDFLNILAFDWKTDDGGRELAYRLMAKKLGVDGAGFGTFTRTFADGLPMTAGAPRLALLDVPTTRFKDLIVWHVFMTSRHPDVAAARQAAQDAGASLACETVMTCGDLTALADVSGRRDDGPRRAEASDRARAALQRIDALFAARPPALTDVRPRRALRDYVEDAEALRRFVGRVGLRRSDRPAEPFPIHVVADAKQNLFNIRWGERSQQFPHVLTEPIRDIYLVMMEFDIRVVLWKGGWEFPWHVGPVPWPGRKILGHVPMPLVPWPWLNAVPGFRWAGVTMSLTLQYLLASDLRIWWGSVSHTKSWSSESMALQSGMGLGSKYYNAIETHRTWHDMGVAVRGPIVGDVNDHFVQVFNEARVNNAGLPASRGVSARRLAYADYTPAPAAAPPAAPAAGAPRTWVLTTHPERGDSSYRGIYVAALAAARRNIYIENSFFSDPLVARLLMHKAREFRGRVNCAGLGVHECAARRREAVQIYLVLPDTSDKPIVDAVGAADFHEMLHLGIKVHRWNPTLGWSASRMLHSKVWLIDYVPGEGGLTYVGAANATQRSHLADNESGILSTDPAFAREVHARIFVADLESASRRESGENFHVVRSSSAIVRGSRWLRRFLVDLLWLI